MLPGLQIVIPGSYAPQAPVDMFSALGKNGQILSISPDKGIVIVRIGDQPNSAYSEIPNIFCNEIWIRLNEIMCNSNSVNNFVSQSSHVKINPNPFIDKAEIILEGVPSTFVKEFVLFNCLGKVNIHKVFTGNTLEIKRPDIRSGIYFWKITGNGFSASGKVMVE